MIICGIIQSPEKNNNQLIIHQVAGLPQNPNSIINAQIDLTSTRGCFENNGIKGWMRKRTKELYLQTTTLNFDAFGRPIALGIYLKKEGKETTCVSHDTIVELLNMFSLKMDDVSISRVESIIRSFSKKGSKKHLSCFIIFVVIALLVLTTTLFAFLSK